VADTTHDFGDDSFHEIHLSGKQLVFLFMATTVVSVIIFLLGVQVGRGVPLQRSQESLSDPATSASAAPAASPPAAEAEPPASEPPAPPAEGAELGYKKRLEEAAASKETLKPPPQAAEKPSPSPPAAPAAAPQAAAGTPQPGTWVLQVHALRDAKVASGIVQRLSKKGYPAFMVASGGPASIYRVFVGRYKDRDEAQRVADRLQKEEQFKPWITR
jgi:cell division septation protein DedD